MNKVILTKRIMDGMLKSAGYTNYELVDTMALSKKVCIEEIEKTAVVGDFLAGVDPTGAATFRRASKHTSHHKLHRTAGDVGGFVGGAAIGAALPAALVGVGSLALRKWNPKMSKQFAVAAKGAVDVLNPFAMSRHVRSIPKAIKYQDLGEEIMASGGRLAGMSKMDLLKGTSWGRLVKDVKGVAGKSKEMQTLGKELSEKYYKGADPITGGMRTVTALTTVPAALGSGVLSASSSHLQYGVAREQKRKQEESRLANLGKRIMMTKTSNFVDDVAKAVEKPIKKKIQKMLYKSMAVGGVAGGISGVGAASLINKIKEDKKKAMEKVNV